MSFQETNQNAGRTNTIRLYLCAHDATVTFSLVMEHGEPKITIIDAVNSATGKDTGISNERLIAAVKAEIKSKNILSFNYDER